MKRTLLLLLLTAGSTAAFGQGCTDLFISEYVEGSGNNKAIEIYNPTNGTIDLSNYQIGRFRDGAGTPMLLDLSGSVSAYGTYVVALDKRNPQGTGNEVPIDAALEAVADTFVNPVYVQSNSPFYFNGDDAFGLFTGDGTELVDLFGKIGEDPGTAWSDANGTWWSNDHTLIRKASVLGGVTVNPAEFVVEAEWDSLPENTFTELGAHTCDCQTMSVGDHGSIQFDLYPNPAADKQLTVAASQGIVAIQVFNILGKEAQQFTVRNRNARRHRLSLEHLPSGVYVVRVSLQNGEVSTRKVMIGK